MFLIAGDQKDEVPWSETLPLVDKLTRLKIGQVWLDHTDHNTDRQYGSSTKAWRTSGSPARSHFSFRSSPQANAVGGSQITGRTSKVA
jgi:hypothetical protein